MIESREHLIRHLWCRAMLDSRTAASQGLSAGQAADLVAGILGTSKLSVGLAVGFDLLSGARALPSREVLEREPSPSPLAAEGKSE